MEWTYLRTPGRGIDVDLGPGWPGFNEALADGVSSMPPRSSRRRGLSTYWIDHVLQGIEVGADDGRALTSGNSTELVLCDDVVVARSLYQVFDDESMSRQQLVTLMSSWRAEVVTHRREFQIGRTYRRNGFGKPRMGR